MKYCPLVSVIIPAYNHELYIEEALQSVINQTYKNIQLIVINDGSMDGTGTVIDKVIEQNASFNIKYINKSNEGICKTLNKGLLLAKGKYVAFLASDDMWTSDRIEKQVYFMEENANIGLVFSDNYFIRLNKVAQVKGTDYKPIIRKCFLNGIQNVNMYEKLLSDDIIPALTVLIRKECFDKVGGFDNNLKAEDYDMWLRIAKEYPIAFIDEPLAYYRVHDSNASNNHASIDGIKTFFSIINKQCKEEPLKHQYIKKIIVYFRFCCTLVKNRFIRVFFIEKKY